MNLRKFELDKDYEKYCKLSQGWDLPITPKSWISEDTYLLENDDEIICLGSLYQLGNTAMYWIEGVITNRNSNRSLRQEGLNILINSLSKLAKEKGSEIIMSSTPRDGLKELFEDCGFKQTPERYYHLGRVK